MLGMALYLAAAARFKHPAGESDRILRMELCGGATVGGSLGRASKA